MVVRFPELVVVAGLIGLPVTGEKTVEMVARMIVVVKLLNWDWTWLRVHELRLPEVRAKLTWH
jgi:hypothetical protein